MHTPVSVRERFDAVTVGWANERVDGLYAAVYHAYPDKRGLARLAESGDVANIDGLASVLYVNNWNWEDVARLKRSPDFLKRRTRQLPSMFWPRITRPVTRGLLAAVFVPFSNVYLYSTFRQGSPVTEPSDRELARLIWTGLSCGRIFTSPT